MGEQESKTDLNDMVEFEAGVALGVKISAVREAIVSAH